MLASVQKEVGARASRDLAGLVKRVKELLPQYSDDAVCEALVQCDEDIERAVDFLLSRPTVVSKSGKKKKDSAGSVAPVASHPPAAEQLAGVGNSRGGAGGQSKQAAAKERQLVDSFEEDVDEDRPKTAVEKEVHKQRKKLREIERIEERIQNGEKVDPLQLPKLDKKSEVKAALAMAEAKMREEARERKAQRDREREEQSILEAARREQERREEEAAREQERRQQQQQQQRLAQQQQHQHHQNRERHDHQVSLQQSPPQTAASGSELLLSMLHAKPAASGPVAYEQTASLARQLGGGAIPQMRTHQQAQQQQQQQSRPRPSQQTAPKPLQSFRNDTREESDSQVDLMNEYSTPLDENQFTLEQRLAADRIAKEIEREGSRENHYRDSGSSWQSHGGGYSGGRSSGARNGYGKSDGKGGGRHGGGGKGDSKGNDKRGYRG